MGAQAVSDEVVRRDVIDSRARSIAHLFRQRVAASGSREAFQYLVPDADGSERVERLTWDQTRQRADAWAAGLVALGVGLEDRVAIASTTRLEWVLADLAIMTAGAYGAFTAISAADAACRPPNAIAAAAKAAIL